MGRWLFVYWQMPIYVKARSLVEWKRLLISSQWVIIRTDKNCALWPSEYIPEDDIIQRSLPSLWLSESAPLQMCCDQCITHSHQDESTYDYFVSHKTQGVMNEVEYEWKEDFLSSTFMNVMFIREELQAVYWLGACVAWSISTHEVVYGCGVKYTLIL